MKEKELSLEYFSSQLRYEPDTGKFYWLVSGRGQTKRAGAEAGSKSSNGYTQLKHGGKVYLAHRLAWLFHYGEWPANEIDHINREKRDNRILNLRQATRSQNLKNTAGQTARRKHSRFKGVSLNHGRTWCVQVMVDGERIVKYGFRTEEEAHEEYKRIVIERNGEFARW